MEELLGISNPGFSFTKQYLSDTYSLLAYVSGHQSETTTYVDLQNSLDNPGRVRMIVPFLRNMGIINASCFSRANSSFSLDNFFTNSSRPFIKAVESYSHIASLDDGEIEKRWRSMFNAILMERYLHTLCQNKEEYLAFIKFLLVHETIDKFEFFVVTSMTFNGTKKLFSLNSVEAVIARYRRAGIDPALYTYRTNVNCYTYMMQVLCDFDVCNKDNDNERFVIKNRERIEQLLGDLL